MKPVGQQRFKYLLLLCFILSLPYRDDANAFEFTPSLYYFQFQEFDPDNRLLVEEKGVLPGLKIGFDHAVGNGSIGTQLSFFSGEIDYNGQTQFGAPHDTDTRERLINLGLRWSSGQLTAIPGRLFLGFRYWDWDRDIQTNNGVLGLHEVYTWNELELGLTFESGPNRNSAYWLELSALYVFDPHMELILPSSRVDFELGQEPGLRVRAGKRWERNERLYTSFNLFAEYWEFGRSKPVFTDDFFGQSTFLVEPRSESFHSGLELTISVLF